MIIYRMMNAGDISQVAAIENEIFSIPWSEQAFAESLNNDNTIFIVADEEGEICAYCGIYISFECGNISNVAVKEEFRNRHIATEMLKELMKQAGEKNVTDITLEVRQTNVAAIKLYEKLGFKEEGIRKNFYEKPTEDALIFWKHDGE